MTWWTDDAEAADVGGDGPAEVAEAAGSGLTGGVVDVADIGCGGVGRVADCGCADHGCVMRYLCRAVCVWRREAHPPPAWCASGNGSLEDPARR